MQYRCLRFHGLIVGLAGFLFWMGAPRAAEHGAPSDREPWLQPYTGATRTDIDATTLDGKVLCGYQGWFNTPGDGSGFGFVHWGQGLERTNGGRFTVDMWPDLSEYAAEDLREVPGLQMPDGSPARLYSAFRRGPVLLHFQWMRQYGIDGVFLSRFIGEAASPSRSRHVNQVLANVREGCHREGRVWAMMLDLSTGRNATTAMVMNDWKFLCDQVKVREDSRYLRHQKKPVVLLWGLGFNDRPWSPEQGEELIRFFKEDPQYGGVYLIGGIDAHWRSLKGASRTNAAWAKVYRMFDAISPWNAGRYRDDASMDRVRRDVWEGDLAELRPKGVGYMPTAFPGFSWDNLRRTTPGSTNIPRRKGEFYWRQFAIYRELGIRTVFVGMFDEVDEGTAIYKVSNEIPVGKHFVTYEGLPTDWYLRLTGAATKMIRGETALSREIPDEMAMRKAPAPLYRDPVHDGAADPTLVWNRAEKCWWMLYTNRRADADDEKGVKWVHGTDIGIASTPDGGATWNYRGIAQGLEFETNATRNTFWAPEVVDYGGKYHAFISYVRGVPETWKGTRDILHYTSTNLMDWKFESIVVPGSIDACIHRLPDGGWRMWFKNEQRKITGTVLDSDDLYTWKPTRSEMPDPDPGKGEGPEVFFWKGWFWMVKDMWRGLGVYRSPDLDTWKFMGVILDKPGKRPGDHRIGQHPGVLVQDNDHAHLIYFVHQAEKEPAYRHTWLQVAKLGFDGNTLTCDRDAEFDFRLKEPRPEFTQEHIPAQSDK